MPKFLRCVAILASMICLFCGGCSSDSARATYPVAVFSDVHFSPFYDQTLFDQLNSSEASGWADIFATSSVSGPSAYGADTNYPLLVLSLQSMGQNLGTSPVVIFTGDILGHGLAQTYYELCGCEDESAMQGFLDKTVAFFTTFVKSYVGNVPVMFALGNADSYSGMSPDETFFANNAETYYSNWIGTASDHQTFLNTFEAGGYYSAQPLGAGLEVIALNSVMLSTQAIGDQDSAVQAQLAWLDSTLASARSSGKKVWLLMHTPLGAYIAQTAAQLDASGHLSTATMMLKSDYQTSLVDTLEPYSDIIVMMLGAHTHMDEFRNAYGGDPLSIDGFLEITPGITPYFNNDPAYKIFTYLDGGFEPLDYRVLNYDLTTAPSQFEDYYTYSTSYFGGSLTSYLGQSLQTLYPALDTNATKQGLFRNHYYSGSSSSSTITDENWKVFWCGIAEVEEQALIDCVNEYQ